MTPVSFRHRISKPDGQLIIFFSVTMIMIISIMAFVVNVGLFVKAKINLQNAVDAAAWSGAAVQSRQLTNIAYLNWEMRNVYKEWMFKYYILGNINLKKTRPGHPDFAASPGASTGAMDFRATMTSRASVPSGVNPEDIGDLYNVPSICIHYSSNSLNICNTAAVPGLPRFTSVGFIQLDDIQKNLVDSIVSGKAENCAYRSEMNYLAALQWTYGKGRDVSGSVTYLGGNTPKIAGHRVGAWTSAFELAIRMRNLEYMVNYPPKKLCLPDSGNNDCQDPGSIEQGSSATGPLPISERPIKAFWSAYRNLGSGGSNDDLKLNFKLTELSPNPAVFSEESLSRLLLPVGVSKKIYLDLQAYPVNYAIFYTAFAASTAEADPNDPAYNGVLASEGTCYSSKVALPVPGYILGFVKNPEILTYYAVMGESQFVGLFNPFENRTKMVAYAAAKPFGGRIGPKLFEVVAGGPLTGRNANISGSRTAPYISGLAPVGVGNFILGTPIPTSNHFWLKDATDAIGGKNSNGDIFFGIPNLLYDYGSSTFSRQKMVNDPAQTGKLLIIQNQGYEDPAIWKYNRPLYKLGLYDREQFEFFNMNLIDGALVTSTLSGADVDHAIKKVRGPTLYDSMNYMVPTMDNSSGTLEIDSVDAIYPLSTDYPSPPNRAITNYRLFAPLFGKGTPYSSVDRILDELERYIQVNKKAIAIYVEALFEVAESMRSSVGGGDPLLYEKAAAFFHNGSTAHAGDLSCDSIAGTFQEFYFGTIGCSSSSAPSATLKQNMKSYLDGIASLGGSSKDKVKWHYTTYAKAFRQNIATGNIENDIMMTAYRPGKRTGADDETGKITNPFVLTNISPVLSARNFYSTKFVSIESLTNISHQNNVFSEGAAGSSQNIKNWLNVSELNMFDGPFTH